MRRLMLCLLVACPISAATFSAAVADGPSDSVTAFAAFQVEPRDAVNMLLRDSSGTLASQLAEQCCKICTTGKACGNSCINRNYQCHQPPGCACDG